MNTLKIKLGKLTVEALLELFFMRPRHTYEYAKQLAALLAQRSYEDINKYLSIQAYSLRNSSGKNRFINPRELYLVQKDCDECGSFECSYMLGETYFEPPLKLPTDNQITELWEYYLRMSERYGLCSFQEFFEKKITETIYALLSYEEMLDQEIVPLEYALLSEQGVLVHNALYGMAHENHTELHEHSRLLKRTDAPLFLQNEYADKLTISKRVLSILKETKPRMA